MGKRCSLALTVLLAIGCLMGCSQPAQQSPAQAPAQSQATAEQQGMDLKGQTLMVYCGAGMKDPFQKIADAFKENTGCNVEVTYANAAQIQTQINTSKEGDLFIAGAAEEVKPVQDSVTDSRDLVKHIPVLVVQKGNPLHITGIADLAKDGVRVLLGDAKSTPIGKIGDQALADFGITDKVNLVARTTTAPLITTSLAAGECDAAIVWKENTNNDKVEIVKTTDMDKYVKTVPAASLKYSSNKAALAEFTAFLDSDTAKQIWTSFGYEVTN